MTKATRKSISHARGNRRMQQKKTLLEGAVDLDVLPVQNYIPPDIPLYLVPEAPIAFWLGKKISSLLRRARSIT